MTDSTVTVPLQCAAHGRTGDKGDRSNISVIAWHPALYEHLVHQVTEAAVAAQACGTHHEGASRDKAAHERSGEDRGGLVVHVLSCGSAWVQGA